ncbi:MAG: hypothetical protein RAO94_07110 [Candidatus Stygibacter australis]|nr:hypothetical protein [Candidatus Stygibacter australis]
MADNYNFPINFRSGNYNGVKILEKLQLIFVDAICDFAGEDYNEDPFNLIDWTTSVLPEIHDLNIQYNAGNIELNLYQLQIL